jgi:aminoglycoside 3-N-acetyltransferase
MPAALRRAGTTVTEDGVKLKRLVSFGVPLVSASGVPGPSIASQVKQRLKPLYFSSQRLLARALFAYSPSALEESFKALGIRPGDSVFVHSGFHRASGFTGSPSDVVESLLKVLGPEGHLLMMSIPYRGSTQRYAEGDPLFDVTRTPSAVGLISEVFRRRNGVLRSLNPFHPVLAYGPLAEWLVADHDKCAHSCGKGSPFERFLNLQGKFLFFDAKFSSLTFMHYVEDRFSDQLPVHLYHPTAALVRVKDATGCEHKVRQFFFSEAARQRRNFAPVERQLLSEGTLRKTRVGNTRLLSVSAQDVVDCAASLIERGPGIYTQSQGTRQPGIGNQRRAVLPRGPA